MQKIVLIKSYSVSSVKKEEGGGDDHLEAKCQDWSLTNLDILPPNYLPLIMRENSCTLNSSKIDFISKHVCILHYIYVSMGKNGRKYIFSSRVHVTYDLCAN